MHGWGAPTAMALRTGPAARAPQLAGRPRYVVRFSATERVLHWVNAVAFFLLLASGLVLYLPRLSVLVGRRPLIKDVHFYTGVAGILVLGLVVALGNRRVLARTVRELDRFDRDDRAWLRGRRTPQGRLNAGQKLNAIVTAAFTILFTVSGLLLWYGERDTRLRLASTILVHDGLMFVALVLVVGHLYLALVHPATRHALRGIVLGTVRADWAAEHHGKWLAELERSVSDASDRGRSPG
jgi:formate dehydrogenase subunit gamma